MTTRFREHLVKLIAVPTRLAACVCLLACVLAATAASASTAPPSPVSANFPGLASRDIDSPPDPSVAMSPTQIVEVVRGRMQVYNRNGGAACAIIDLNDFFDNQPGEDVLTAPRVIYDNASGKFTVMVAAQQPPPPPSLPHEPFVDFVKLAHNSTSDACSDEWFKYTLRAPVSDTPPLIADGSFIDEPAIGQDPALLLFGATLFDRNGAFSSFVAFSYPKSCAYSRGCSASFQVFPTRHYAAPASSAGNPMITTENGYYVASVPGTGYELYRMADNGTSFAFQATIASGQSVVPPPRDAIQPGTSNRISLHAASPDLSTRITSSPVFDGSRIWFTHETGSGIHPSVRYGAINPANNTVATEIVYHNATSDDFNPSLAVGVNGASRTIYLNWAFTDPGGGMPVSPAIAAVTIGATGPPPPVIGKDTTLIAGGITNDAQYGEYSSVSVDPRSPSQVCAVTAQEYFDFANNGKWATRIALFGIPGC